MKPSTLSIMMAVNGVLLAVTAALWGVGDLAWQPPDARRPEPSSLQPARIEVVHADLATLSQSIERPLFAQSRRPVPVVAVELAQPEPDPLRDVELLGVIDAGEASRTVIIRAEGRTRRVKVGEAVGQWILQSMAGRLVTFQRAGEQRQVMLKHRPQPMHKLVAVQPAVEEQASVVGEPAKPGESAPPPAAPQVSAAPAPQSATRSSSSDSGRGSLMQRIAERRARIGSGKQ